MLSPGFCTFCLRHHTVSTDQYLRMIIVSIAGVLSWALLSKICLCLSNWLPSPVLRSLGSWIPACYAAMQSRHI